MKKIIGNVFEEDDYSVFRKLPDNRDVLSDRVRKLIASMTERYVINPIIVNEKMEVIDGQGRFEARKEIGEPIHYIVVEGANSDDCRRMNKYNTKWTGLDFAKSYAKKGCASYIILLRTCNKTKLSIGTVLRLGNRGSTAAKAVDKMSLFESGKLTFTEKDAEVVEKVNTMANEILEALQFTARVNDPFRTGVKIMVETDGYDHERMLRNCKTERHSYVQTGRLKDQLVEFERIYNKRARENSKIYFSDALRNKGSNVRDYTHVYSPYDDINVSTLKTTDS